MYKRRRSRGRTEILGEIIEIAREGTTKSSIMYHANLSYSQLKEYLAALQEEALVEIVQATRNYRVTEKGRSYYDSYRHVRCLIGPAPAGHVPTMDRPADN